MQSIWLGTWARFLLGQRLAPFVPTPHHVANAMLDLAQAGPKDVVYDLGCGDGRLVILAAKRFGARGRGFELHPKLVLEAKSEVEREGLSNLIQIEERDALTVGLQEATIVTLYLSTQGNLKLLPRMRSDLQSGSRVVSFCWPFHGLEPDATRRVDGIDLYLYKF